MIPKYDKGDRLVFIEQSSLNGPLFGDKGDLITFCGRSDAYLDRCIVTWTNEKKSKLFGEFFALYDQIERVVKEYSLDQQLDEDEDLL